jgi:hypothetical protein
VTSDKKIPGTGIKAVGINQVAVPIMSIDDTLKREPASGKEVKLVTLPEGITTAEFKDVVSATYLAFIGGPTGKQATKGSGAAPTVEQIMRYVPNIPKARIQVIMGLDAYKKTCWARGITTVGKPGLSAEQELALSIILDPSAGKGLSQRLRKAGVTRAKYEAWRRNPVFAAHLAQIGENVLKANETDMMVTLAGLGADGDLNAIKFAFEVTGRHDPQQRQIMDVQQVMAQMVEIVKTHVKDPATLEAIGRDLMMLASTTGAVPPAAPTNSEPELPPIEIEA